ncbi:cupin domain-containing protein [Paenibacillus nicotianae]|uniref:Cupin domain-containing protein n=1 Tax=Paenibacillus nicotianae TaxID=1526551 RepID=A0ABW4UXN8_9BACL
MTDHSVQTYYFEPNHGIPNHPTLPVLLYPQALQAQPADTESIFNQNHWLNSWTNGVFDYHHYHSNAHEVLGVISGHVTVQLGGEEGQSVTLYAGDVVVLPAGTGHKRISASSDFRMVGAYPDGMSYNTRTATETEKEHATALAEISHVPLPKMDPIYGPQGPLLQYWHSV